MNGMIGKTIGKYRITDHLGRGGMAEVYKAYQPNLDRYVAIKLMHAFLADEKEFLTRFEREAKVVATLRHPNIVQVYDFDVAEGVYYMVMEFISGETLKARMQELEAQGEWISLDDSARIILSVGSALKYAHEHGMVHRDVKPANVMITIDGQVILTDFGIAKIVSASNLTASGAMVGTPSYMAPEQGMGQPGDERSDIYSLGVMLYQLVLGRLPYDADTPLAVVLKHINEPLPMPQAIKPDLPDELNRVILKTLAKDPVDRYQKVGELAADLRKAMGMSPEDSHPNAAKAGAIKLTGATMVGRVGGGVTPLPKAAPQPMEAAAATAAGAVTSAIAAQTQVASPQTVVAAGTGSAATAISTPTAETATTVAAPPAKRPAWLLPAIGLAIVAVIAVIAMVALGGRGGGGTQPTQTIVAVGPDAQPTDTPAPISTSTVVPITTQVLTLTAITELRDKAGSDPASQVEGLLQAGAQFFVKSRTADSQWARIELQDGTSGYIAADATGLTADQLAQVPLATTLLKPTDTSTPTLEATDTPTPTLTAAPTNTPAPTRTPGPTRPPATRAPSPTPTGAAATEQLGYGFSFDHCDYGGNNYTCNLTVWGSGGSGSYFFAMQSPDTGLWDQRGPIDRTVFLMRSRRCKIQIQELRVWDSAGNYLSPNPNITMDPNAIASLFPGGSCTQ